MKKMPKMLAILTICCIAAAKAVPLSMVINSPGIMMPPNNGIEEESKDGGGANPDDDFTAHPLERLSSAATCLVAGVEYTHGQQIFRRDQCEFCLCLDGEMFCWWQECPPTQEGPCKNRTPLSPCQNGDGGQKSSTTPTPPTVRDVEHQPEAVAGSTQSSIASSTAGMPMFSASDMDAAANSSDEISDYIDTTAVDNEEMLDVTATNEPKSDAPVGTSMTATEPPKYCFVMGRRYSIGDRLPHDTGNCVECTCGEKAQITCSPHQCAPSPDDVVDEINDYRPPGLRGAQPDVF